MAGQNNKIDNNKTDAVMDSILPIDLQINSELSVRCNRIARQLPEKRIVYQGMLGDRDVFIKHYFDANRARIHWQREHHGLTLMQDRGIDTADIVYSGKVAHDSGYVIVTDAIEPADDFASAWKDSVNDDNKRTTLLSALMDCVAAHHNAGLVQKDIHLGNFLVSNNTVYTLDGSDIEDCSPVSTDKALSNMALLAAQFLPAEDSLIESLFSHYVNKRSDAFDTNVMSEFITRRNQQRETRKQRYLKKIFSR